MRVAGCVVVGGGGGEGGGGESSEEEEHWSWRANLSSRCHHCQGNHCTCVAGLRSLSRVMLALCVMLGVVCTCLVRSCCVFRAGGCARLHAAWLQAPQVWQTGRAKTQNSTETRSTRSTPHGVQQSMSMPDVRVA